MSPLEMNYELSGSELIFNQKLTKNELKLNKKIKYKFITSYG